MMSGLKQLAGELFEHTEHDFRRYFGRVDPAWIRTAVEYFWDESQQDARVAELSRWGLRPEARVLDLAGGHGQFVFRALEMGYDCYGVEPDAWKVNFARRKLAATGRPEPWSERLVRGVGEALPFDENAFDGVTSYQTLEHVQDPEAVLAEMIRVTRPGGAILLRCPDYRSTFEGHYRLPWLPLFPRGAARAWLRLLGRPVDGLDTIQYVTAPRIRRWITRIEVATPARVLVINGDQVAFADAIRRAGLPEPMSELFLLYRGWAFIAGAFRREASVNLVIRILEKGSACASSRHAPISGCCAQA